MNFKSIISKFAMLSLAIAAFSACEKEQEKVDPDTLKVEPSSAILFKASGNEDVTLKVTTNVEDWNYTAPAWVKAEKKSNELVINVVDNDGEDRVGRIVFTAGKADPVKISVTQTAAGAVQPEPGDGVVVTFNQVSEQDIIYLGSDPKATVKANITIPQAVSEDVVVDIVYDEAYLSEYNYNQGAEYLLFPKDKATYAATLTIKAGQTKSDDMEITLDGSSLGFGSGYLVPLRASVKKDSGVTVDRKHNRANFVLMRQNAKTIKNVLYFEVNDCNPLNALEYVLEDGTPFFDAVILFSANINYNSGRDRVYLHNNPNVQALLDETDVYIQPLRKKGIKVYLGILGNHDAAGVCQLSDWGCHEWAKEVADAVKEYKLDGVSLDDEYSSGPISGNPWFTNYPNSKAGSQLMLELKLAMKEACYWPTEVSYFVWGNLNQVSECNAWNPETDQKGGSATGQSYKPSQFVDFFVANYGGNSYAHADFTNKNCSCMSIECNLGRGGIDENRARQWKESGYGWCMWFAFDPSGTGSIQSNFWRSFPMMQAAARGFYDQELKRPTGVYNKIGEGQYDPVRHEKQF